MNPFSDASQRFALDLFQKLMQEKSETNFIASPLSAQIILAMILAASDGKTASEIRKALHLGWEDSVTSTDGPASGTQCGKPGGFHNRFKEFITRLSQDFKRNSLMMGSGIFGSVSYSILDTYQYCIKDLCSAHLERLDFRNAPEEARERINAWVTKLTHGRVTNFFPINSIDVSTLMILLNTVTFSGSWMTPFHPRNTEKGVFWTCKDQSIYVDMMIQKGRFEIANISNPSMKMLVLPLNNDSLCMHIFMPDSHDSPKEIVENLTVEQLQRFISTENRRSIETTVYLPKFSMQDHNSLNRVFMKMGMEDLFTPGKANLSGMTGSNQVSVSSSDQLILFAINEEGAVATGVSRTEILHGTPSDFKVNKSFWFLVLHKVTRLILFFGIVCNPKWVPQ